MVHLCQLGHLAAYFFIPLPTAFVATAFQFWRPLRQGRAMAGYLASVLLLVSSQVVGDRHGGAISAAGTRGLIDLVGFVNIMREMEASYTD